jgi:hypothetical protein
MHCYLLRMCTIQGIETYLWAADLPFPIVGCISESDAGLQTAERLQSDLCRGSGGINRARRDKFLMNEALKSAGMLLSCDIIFIVSGRSALLSLLQSLCRSSTRAVCGVKHITAVPLSTSSTMNIRPHLQCVCCYH